MFWLPQAQMQSQDSYLEARSWGLWFGEAGEGTLQAELWLGLGQGHKPGDAWVSLGQEVVENPGRVRGALGLCGGLPLGQEEWEELGSELLFQGRKGKLHASGLLVLSLPLGDTGASPTGWPGARGPLMCQPAPVQ